MNSTTHFSKISNAIFLILSTLILSFIWLNYYLKNLKLSLISATIICIVVAIVFFSIKYYKRNKSKTKNAILKNNENITLSLKYSTFESNMHVISELFNFHIKQIIDSHHYISEENQDIYVYFDKDQINELNIQNIVKSRKSDNIKVFSFAFSTITLPDCIKIEFFNINDILDKIKDKKSIIIQNIYSIKKAKLSIKDYLCVILSKKRSRGYFNFGLLLLFTSLFTIYHTYYIIFGTILILLSIFSRFNVKFN